METRVSKKKFIRKTLTEFQKAYLRKITKQKLNCKKLAKRWNRKQNTIWSFWHRAHLTKRICDCGRPVVRFGKNNSFICERCYKIEREMYTDEDTHYRKCGIRDNDFKYSEPFRLPGIEKSHSYL